MAIVSPPIIIRSTAELVYAVKTSAPRRINRDHSQNQKGPLGLSPDGKGPVPPPGYWPLSMLNKSLWSLLILGVVPFVKVTRITRPANGTERPSMSLRLLLEPHYSI